MELTLEPLYVKADVEIKTLYRYSKGELTIKYSLLAEKEDTELSFLITVDTNCFICVLQHCEKVLDAHCLKGQNITKKIKRIKKHKNIYKYFLDNYFSEEDIKSKYVKHYGI